MKLIMILIAMHLGVYGFSQTWTQQELQVLEHFNISKSDIRGIHFTESSNEELTFPHLVDVFEYFFNEQKGFDVIHVYVEQYPDGINLENKTIGIKEIVETYLLTDH